PAGESALYQPVCRVGKTDPGRMERGGTTGQKRAAIDARISAHRFWFIAEPARKPQRRAGRPSLILGMYRACSPASSRTTRRPHPSSDWRPFLAVRGLALELLVAFAVVTAAFLDPLQTAIRVGRLVGFVLVETGMHPCFAGGFFRVLRRHGIRKHWCPGGFWRCRRCGGSRWGGRRRGSSSVGSALRLSEIAPFLFPRGAPAFSALYFGLHFFIVCAPARGVDITDRPA